MTPRISYLTVFILLCGLSIVLWSCVDVSTTNLATQDYRTLARFYDAAVDTAGSIALTVDGASLGNLSLSQSINYTSIKAGARNLAFAGVTQTITFNTDDQVTIIVHPSVKGKRFFYAGEGDSKKNNAVYSTRPNVRFVNLSQGNALSFREGSASGAAWEGSVAYESESAYDSLPTGAHHFFVVATGDYLATIDGAQDNVVTRSSASGSFELSYDNGLTYSISDTVDNSQGFYTAAHFHLGAVGVSGPVLEPIDVSVQTISIGDVALAPVDTTVLASGKGSFSMNADAGRTTDTLTFSVSLKPDSANPFTSAEFDSVGGVAPLSMIATGAPTFLDTTVAGQWAFSGAIYSAVMRGKVYVNVKTAAHPTGALKGTIVPDSFTVNTFAGTWNDSTLADSVKQDFVAGKIYVNFHTVANPAGQIRGQVLVDPDKGHYGVTSLAVDSTYLAGHAYTIVSVGTGSTMKLYKFTDRQVGVTKQTAGIQASAPPAVRTAKNSLR